WSAIDRLDQQAPRLGVGPARGAIARFGSPQQEIVGLEHSGRRPAQTNPLGFGELHRHGPDDLLADLVLQGKDVAHLAVVAVGPDVIAGRRVHQLRRYPQAIARTLHAALQDAADSEAAAHLA